MTNSTYHQTPPQATTGQTPSIFPTIALLFFLALLLLGFFLLRHSALSPQRAPDPEKPPLYINPFDPGYDDCSEEDGEGRKGREEEGEERYQWEEMMEKWVVGRIVAVWVGEEDLVGYEGG